MNKKLLALAATGLLCTMGVSAHDFEVDGIYYNIMSEEDKTVEVTYQGGSCTSYEEYSGAVDIPTIVTYDGQEYSVTSIGNEAFAYCNFLTSVQIPNSVTSIGNVAFAYCYSLTSVQIPNSVTSIDMYAFDSCTGLTSVEIPKSVVSIGANLFSYCSNLSSLVVAADNPVYDSREGCNAIIESASNTLIASCPSSTIPDGVTSIGDYAFQYCDGLTSVEIPNSVTSIGDDAFSFCYDLTSVEIPNSVTSIGNYAFYNCYALTSVEFPNSVTSIGEQSFSGCQYLTSVEIPNSLTSIGNGAFSNCENLSSIVVAEDNEVYDSRGGCNAIIESATNAIIAACQTTTIPEGITSIADYAFYNHTGLTSVEIPNSVTSIGNYAFYECSGLTSVEIPNSVTSIGSSAFSGCSGLTSVEIPNSVTSIGSSAFSGCSGLTSVTIPGSITTIEWYTFSGCSNLTSVYIQDGIKSIDVSAFQHCEKLENVELPASVTSIGGSAFADCENLELIQVAPENEIYCSFNSNGIWGVYSKDMSELIAVPGGATGEFVIPETVKSVNYGACDGCKNLTSVVIPASVSHIGEYAFADCEGMTLITSNIPADKLFSISTNVFQIVNKANCFLNVPCGAQATYAATEGWGGFKIIPYELTISDAGYATLYLDYTAQIPEGVSVYTANEVEGNLLKMELVEGLLPANTGVVVKAPAGTYTFTYSDTYAPEISDNLFKGSATYEYVDVASTQTAFVLSKVDGEVGMYPAKLTDGRFLNNANKAYLLLDGKKLGVSDEELDTSVGGSQLSLRFDFGGTTGVDKVQTESGADAVIYDLYGRKVNKATTPGFYIINNKKVWVK